MSQIRGRNLCKRPAAPVSRLRASQSTSKAALTRPSATPDAQSASLQTPESERRAVRPVRSVSRRLPRSVTNTSRTTDAKQTAIDLFACPTCSYCPASTELRTSQEDTPRWQNDFVISRRRRCVCRSWSRTGDWDYFLIGEDGRVCVCVEFEWPEVRIRKNWAQIGRRRHGWTAESSSGIRVFVKNWLRTTKSKTPKREHIFCRIILIAKSNKKKSSLYNKSKISIKKKGK